VEEQSPLSPLSRSAASLRQQMTPQKVEEERPWSLALTAGIEWDSNPTFAGGGIRSRKEDFRGVFRVRGSYQLVDLERFSLTAGYDGYLSLHQTVDEVDLQTHVGWLSGGLNYDPVRFGLRYDYAYTMIDLSHKFRSLNRITPSVTYRESDWGVAQAYFQWQNADFLRGVVNPPTEPDAFDRDSNRYTFGINQFFFLPDLLPEQITYVRIGALGELERADSADFSYDGCEVSAGAAADLPFAGRVREDFIHRLTAELTRPIGEHFEVSVATSQSFNDSNIKVYDHNRAVVGAYLSYRF
jgi:hypothetical protein